MSLGRKAALVGRKAGRLLAEQQQVETEIRTMNLNGLLVRVAEGEQSHDLRSEARRMAHFLLRRAELPVERRRVAKEATFANSQFRAEQWVRHRELSFMTVMDRVRAWTHRELGRALRKRVIQADHALGFSLVRTKELQEMAQEELARRRAERKAIQSFEVVTQQPAG